jgi:hypothetical protein
MTTDYTKMAHDVLAKAKVLIEEDKWEHVITTEGTELYKRPIPEVCPIPCYYVKTIIKKPLETLVDKLWIIDENGIKTNDPSVKEWKEVEKTEGYKICTQYNKMGTFIWDRHVVYAQVKIQGTESTQIVSFSVTHSSAPFDEKNYVRGNIHMSVFEFKKDPVDESSTIVTKVSQIDPCGDLPVSVINLFASAQVDVFNRWKKD